MRNIGIVGQVSPFAESHWMRNGSTSQEICWDNRPLSEMGHSSTSTTIGR